jgi:hypothetical protein
VKRWWALTALVLGRKRTGARRWLVASRMGAWGWVGVGAGLGRGLASWLGDGTRGSLRAELGGHGASAACAWWLSCEEIAWRRGGSKHER